MSGFPSRTGSQSDFILCSNVEIHVKRGRMGKFR